MDNHLKHQIFHQSHRIKSKLPKKLEVYFELGTGELNIYSSQFKEVMRMDFQYNVEELRPKIDCKKTTEHNSKISILQPDVERLNNPYYHYIWNIFLNKDITTSLTIKTGAAKIKIRMCDLVLNELNINSGMGESLIDFGNAKGKHVHAHLKVGYGKQRIIVPKETGVKMFVSKGIGNVSCDEFRKEGNYYVNQSITETENAISLHVENDLGNIEVWQR